MKNIDDLFRYSNNFKAERNENLQCPYVDSYDRTFLLINYFYFKNKRHPKFFKREDINGEIKDPSVLVEKIKKNNFKEIFRASYPNGSYLYVFSLDDCIVNLEINYSNYVDAVFDNEEIFNNFISMVKTETKPTIEKKKISLVISRAGGSFDTKEKEIPINDFDIGLHYGEDFREVNNFILNKIVNPDKSGLYLFHGDPGTGKTYYIKYLINNIDRKFIYIPPTMFKHLSEPSFISFLSEEEGAVIIIEDAESLLLKRDSGNDYGVSSLLNFSNGLLGDFFNFQIICTYNVSNDSIDEAIMRDGRLIAEHCFNRLSIEDSKKLCEHLKKDIKITKPMTVSEIYNYNQTIRSKKQERVVGFA